MTPISPETETNDDSEPSTDARGLTATLYLRSAPSGPAVRRQRTVRDRFESLDEHGLADRRIERWARTVTTPVTEGDEAVDEALARYEAFAAAVAEADGRLEPFFQQRDRSSGMLVGGRSDQVVTFPVCCLALTRDGDVTGLYPCWLDGTHHSVEGGLDAIEAGNPENLR
jgi:hypothetical protein